MIESLTDVIKLVIGLKQESHTIHLLRALPLFHLLRGDCTPFEPRVVRPSAIIWNDSYVDLTTTQQVMTSKKGSVVHQLLYILADHVQNIFVQVFFRFRYINCSMYGVFVKLYLYLVMLACIYAYM